MRHPPCYAKADLQPTNQKNQQPSKKTFNKKEKEKKKKKQYFKIGQYFKLNFKKETIFYNSDILQGPRSETFR